MNLFTKQKKTYRHRKQTMATKGEWGGMNLESVISRYKLLYIKHK